MAVVVASSADEWAQMISESFVPLSLGDVADTFRGSVEQTVLFPGVTVTDVHTHGRSIVRRTQRLTKAEPREAYVFSLHLDGSGTVIQGDREAVLRPGAGALYDTARPYQLDFPTSTREIVLQMPRRVLRDRVVGVDDACGRALPARHPATRLLAAFLRELASASPELEEEHRAELAWTGVELLATALRAALGEERTFLNGRQALLHAMKIYVREHLSDPDLTTATLAQRHGISMRYAADLFAEAETSPAAFIRGQRLHAAYRALADPRQAHRTAASIAAQYGFADRTTFTRAFVRHYGITPAELRDNRPR